MIRCARSAGAGAVIVLTVMAPAVARPDAPRWPNRHENDVRLYGNLDQKEVLGANGTLGRWACGPTSLVNSLHYLQKRFPSYTAPIIDPEKYPIPDEPDDMGNPRNMMIDRWEMIRTVEALAGPAYMKQTKGMAPGPTEDPYEYRRTESPGMPGDDRPNDPNVPGGGIAGGVTWQRFAFGKDCWLTRPGTAPTVMQGQLRIPWTPPIDPNNPPPQPPDLAGMKPAWIADNVLLNMNLMFDALWTGADVEIGFTWSTGFGGHFVTVYGYDFNGDVNGNKIFDNGDSAVLKAIDPWGLGAGAVPVNITITRNNATGEIDIDYVGGAAGLAGATGTMKIWCSEIPGPSGLGLLLVGSLIAQRRRRA